MLYAYWTVNNLQSGHAARSMHWTRGVTVSATDSQYSVAYDFFRNDVCCTIELSLLSILHGARPHNDDVKRPVGRITTMKTSH